MPESQHDRLQLSPLFDGPVDPDAVAGWPAWAREHLDACASCRALLQAERRLRSACQLLVASEQRRGPPSPAERAARLAAREPPAIDHLVQQVQPLPEQVMRFEGSPLELQHSARRLRAWHPSAHELLLLSVEPDRYPVVLEHHRVSEPGVSLELDYRPDRGARLLAVAADQPLEPEHWVMWLRDALASGQLTELVSASHSPYVHIREATLEPHLSVELIRIQRDPHPPVQDDITAILKRAAAAGRADNAGEAARLYRQALELAFARGDALGQIKAAIGVSIALKGLGYPDDAEGVVRWLIDTHALEPMWASWLCRHMATDAMYRMALDESLDWVEQSRVASDADVEWGVQIEATALFHQRRWAELLPLTERLLDAEITPGQRLKTNNTVALATAHRGDLEGGLAAHAALELSEDDPLELWLHHEVVRTSLCQLRGAEVDWDAVVRSAIHQIDRRPDAPLSTWDHGGLLELAEGALRDRASKAAAAFVRLRFLDTRRAVDPELRLVAACRAPLGPLLVAPERSSAVSRLPMSIPQLRDRIADARRQLRAGGTLDGAHQLAELLLSRLEPGRGPVLVSSDGLLAGAPMAAFAGLLAGPRTLAFRELVGHGLRPAPRDPTHTDIVSIADAAGDLPWASREVERGEAALWLRGEQAVRSALRLEASCGLLHIGVHARRELGEPQLLFADGPLGPLEIEQLSLPGAPVVLLAGCFTAAAMANRGIERSLADAFLRAGASAVIATHWPVSDQELHHIVRALVESWPFDDPARQVAEVCAALRRQGHPPSCWAAPVVY